MELAPVGRRAPPLDEHAQRRHAERSADPIGELLGQLEGRAYKPATPSSWAGWSGDVSDDRLKVEWVVRGGAGGVVQLTARHERAGVVRVQVRL